MLMDPNNSFAMDPRMVAIGRWSSWKRSSPKTQKIFSKCAVTPKIAVKKDPKLWIHIPKDVALMSQKNNRFQSYVQMPKTTAPQIQLPKYQVQVPNSFFFFKSGCVMVNAKSVKSCHSSKPTFPLGFSKALQEVIPAHWRPGMGCACGMLPSKDEDLSAESASRSEEYSSIEFQDVTQHSYGKSQFLMGQLTINCHFQ